MSKVIVSPARHQTLRVTKFLLIGFASLALFLAIHLIPDVASAQRVSLTNIADQVYQEIPSLPLENQYVSAETGQVAETNTLISRLLRYHTLVRGRPANFRLDWKFTLADYLGANERIFPDTYPGADTLRINPLAGDTAALQRLNRVQREELITTILTAFGVNPNTPQVTPSPTPSPTVTPQPSPSPGTGPANPALPRAPRPGDAQLLLP